MAGTRAIEAFDVTEHDLVLSSSVALAKGVITRPDSRISPISTARRAMPGSDTRLYQQPRRPFGAVKRHLAREMMHRFRIWDLRTPPSIDVMVANSQFHSSAYSQGLWPRCAGHLPASEHGWFAMGTEYRDEFYLTASRLVPYKRVDLIVRAFSHMPEKRLVVIGDGPEMKRIKALATPNVEILGYQPFEVLRDHMQRARAFVFAAQEDFGIVPLEAQACGTPVIALNHGGTAETLRGLGRNRPTGVHFDTQNEASLCKGVAQFEAYRDLIDPEDCRRTR